MHRTCVFAQTLNNKVEKVNRPLPVDMKKLTRIKTERNAGVFNITLSRPEKLNCLDLPMLEQLDEQIAVAEQDDAIRVVVIRGAGEKAFCSGGDLKAFAGLNETELIHWIHFGNQVFNRVEALLKPTVAAVHGYTMGGGLELALACDFRIACENTVFAMPELQHGWMPGWGALARLQKLAGTARAKEIVLKSHRYNASEFLAFGLVNRMVPNDALEEAVSTFISPLLSVDSKMIAMAKSILNTPSLDTDFRQIWLDALAASFAKNRLTGNRE